MLLSKDASHIRGGGAGRDDAVYEDLKRRLGCTGAGLRSWLKTSGTTPQEFLAAFFSAIQPLSAMYREVYSSMRQAKVDGAVEFARISLSDGRETLDLDLQHFARWVPFLGTALTPHPTIVWDDPSISALMDVGFKLVGVADYSHLAYDACGELSLEPLPHSPSDLTLASALKDAHSVLRGVLEGARASGVAPSDYVLRPSTVGAFNEISRRLAAQSPSWIQRQGALRMLEELPRSPRADNTPHESPVEVLRKVLDLPLWRYRWYLYEVWTAFRIIRAVGDFRPSLLVDADGRIALVRGRATAVATFLDGDGQSYTLSAQKETSVTIDGRRGVAPDYRIDAGASGKTLLIVECKQWGIIVGSKLVDTMKLYERGCADSAVNLFVNYDAPEGEKTASPRTVLIELFRPGNSNSLSRFDTVVNDGLEQAGISAGKLVVLLDVSESMRGKYGAESHAAFSAWLQEHRAVAVFTFADRLGGRVEIPSFSKNWSSLSFSGGTDLDGAVRQVREELGPTTRVLAVTDVRPSEYSGDRVTLWLPCSDGPAFPA